MNVGSSTLIQRLMGKAKAVITEADHLGVLLKIAADMMAAKKSRSSGKATKASYDAAKARKARKVAKASRRRNRRAA